MKNTYEKFHIIDEDLNKYYKKDINKQNNCLKELSKCVKEFNRLREEDKTLN